MKEETMAMDPKLMKMLEEEYEALYMKTKNPCTSSREREVMFRLIEGHLFGLA